MAVFSHGHESRGLHRLVGAPSEEEAPEDWGRSSVLLRSNRGGGSDGCDFAEKPRL